MFPRLIWILFGAGLVLIVGASILRAADITCPTADPCKVITLTPQEETFLLQPGGILDTAQAGRLVELSGPVRYFREKIQNAPAGEPARRPPAGQEPAK